MNIQRCFLASLFALPIMIKVVSCTKLTDELPTKKSIDEFIDEVNCIRENIMEGLTRNYTLFRYIDRVCPINDFLSLYQSLYGQTNHQEEFTVIKVRHMASDEDSNSDLCVRLFGHAIRKHLKNEEKNFTTVGDLAITMEYVKRANLSEYSRVNEATDTLINMRNDFSIYAIENMFDIGYETLKVYLISDIKWFLYNLLSAKFTLVDIFAGNIATYGEMCFELYVGEMRSVSFMIKRFLQGHYTIGASPEKFFNMFCQRFLKKENGKYTTCCKETENLLWKVFNDYLVLEKHKNEFETYIDSMLCKFILFTKLDSSKKEFLELFSSVCADMIEQYKAQRANKSTPISMTRFRYDYIKKMDNCANIQKMYGKYFATLDFDKHKQGLEKQYRARNDKICEHFRREKTSRIVLNGKFDASSSTHLLQILKSANVFANNFRYQMIYVDNDRSIEIEDLLSGATLYKTKNTLFESGIKYNVSQYERLEVFTTARSDNRENSRSANALVSWKSGEITECINGRVNLEFNPIDMPCTAISVRDYSTTDMSVDRCIKDSLETTRDKIESVKVIKLENMTEEVKIYVVLRKPQMSQIGATMLIYDISQKDLIDISSDILKTERRIKCINNVTIPMLNNLVSSLEFHVTSEKDRFIIPNICTINEEGIVYNVMSYNLYNRANIFQKELEANYLPKGCIVESATIRMKQLIEYDFKCSYPVQNDSIKCASKELGLCQTTLYDILAKFKLSVNIKNCLDADILSYERILKNCIVKLYALHQQDGSMTLQVWENPQDFLSLGGILPFLPKIYLNILANDSIKHILVLFMQLKNICGLERCFAFTILLKICKELNSETLFGQCNGSHVRVYELESEIRSIISKLLTEKIAQTEENEEKKAELMSLQKTFDSTEIMTSLKLSHEEFCYVIKKRTLKIIEIRIKDSEKHLRKNEVNK